MTVQAIPSPVAVADNEEEESIEMMSTTSSSLAETINSDNFVNLSTQISYLVNLTSTQQPTQNMTLKVPPQHLIHTAANHLGTKITSTIGPASASKEVLAKMVEAGMNIIRINMGHSSHEFAAKVISDLRELVDNSTSTAEVAIWIDINGPKIRLGLREND